MISEKLKALKTEKNLTTQQLSELSGLPVSSISRILSGQTDSPGFLAVADLVRAMGGSLDEIAGLKTPEPQKAPEPPKRSSEYQDIIKLYERSIAAKNAWLKRLAITCCVLVGVLVFIILFDILNGSVGFIRY